jgi:hypothetical protein
MARRPGKTISFYTDIHTADKLHKMAKNYRSISECLTAIIIEVWNDPQFWNPISNQSTPKPYTLPVDK